MKKLLFAVALGTVAACANPDPNQVYSCVLYAVCDGNAATEDQNVCEGGQDEAQSAVDNWVSSCETTLIDEGCSSYDCYADCEPTGDACDMRPSTGSARGNNEFVPYQTETKR
jgi:hypothetical protein